MQTVILNNSELTPAAWRDDAASGAERVFNPGLLRTGDGWLLAYRVVTEPKLARRIALCRLDASFSVVEGSSVPLSDLIHFSAAEDYPVQVSTWFADPRLLHLRGRLFVHWNSGWHEPHNHQFLHELDPVTLRPVGAPRELVLKGQRQRLEKNWMLFEPGGGSPAADPDDKVFAIYSVNPHRLLTVPLEGESQIECSDVRVAVPNPGGFARLHGGLRGGAPPQRCGDRFYGFCHSIEEGATGYRYVPSVYRFSAQFPFAPTDMPKEALRFEVPATERRRLPRLNPAVDSVLYPGGAAFRGGKWVVSFGIDDERCGIAVLEPEEVTRTLSPESTRSPDGGS